MLNARAWLVWIAAALAASMLATNPLYLVIVLLCAALVRAGHSTSASPLPVWRFGLSVVGFSTVYNALLTHFGSTILVTLPRVLPLVSGPVTLEAAAFGASRGLALWALFAACSVFNDVVSPYEVVRMTPRFLRQAGMVVSVMLAFVPQTARSFHQVREAQAIRGHRLRGVRDLGALLVPLLTDALEKAVQLAEAMEARGYGQISNRKSAGVMRRWQAAMSAGLAVLLLGWLIEAYWHGWAGWAVLAAGAALLGLGLRLSLLQASFITRYRAQRWSARDTVLAASGLVPLLVVIAVAVLDPASLAYYPYPKASLPPFDPRLGLCLVLLGAPAFMRPVAARQPAQSPATAGK